MPKTLMDKQDLGLLKTFNLSFRAILRKFPGLLRLHAGTRTPSPLLIHRLSTLIDQFNLPARPQAPECAVFVIVALPVEVER